MALLWIVAFVGLGTILFSRAHDDGHLAASGTTPPPQFYAPIYSLDVFLPIVDLQQESTRAVTASASAWVDAYSWLHISFGWLLSPLAVIAVTGIVRRE